MKRILTVVFLLGAATGVSAQTSISITNIDRTTAATLSLITINGNGFDAGAAISVVFSARDAISVTVPAVTAASSAIRVAVPPLINRNTGGLMDTSVVAEVQVVQISSSSVITSNTLGGLTIEAPPASNDPPGTFTRALLRTLLDVETDLRRGRQSSPGFGDVLSSSQRFTDSQAALVDAVALILRSPDATANLPARDNLPLLLNSRSLRAMDRVGTAFVQQANSAFRTSSGGPVTTTTCTCNPITEADRWLCEFRQNSCIAYDPARRVVQEGAIGSYGAQFSLLGSWAAGGLSGAASETAGGLGLLVAQAMAYASSIIAGVEPQGTWGLLRDNGTSLFNDLNDSGLSVFLGLQVALELSQRTETVVAQTRPPAAAPTGGLVLPAPQPSNPPANTRPTRIYGTGVGPKWIATPITQTVTPVTSATLPASLVSRFNGTYSGTAGVTCTIVIPESAPVTQASSEPITGIVVSNGTITGGGTLSDTGRFTAPSVNASGVSCSTGGLFWSVGTGAGEAGGNGFVTCSGGASGVSLNCSGTWTVRRQ